MHSAFPNMAPIDPRTRGGGQTVKLENDKRVMSANEGSGKGEEKKNSTWRALLVPVDFSRFYLPARFMPSVSTASGPGRGAAPDGPAKLRIHSSHAKTPLRAPWDKDGKEVTPWAWTGWMLSNLSEVVGGLTFGLRCFAFLVCVLFNIENLNTWLGVAKAPTLLQLFDLSPKIRSVEICQDLLPNHIPGSSPRSRALLIE
jgi:hypothetical protein